jgi:hypothetical protein
VGLISAVHPFTHTITDVWGLVAEFVIVAAVVACFVAVHAYLQRYLRSEVLRRHNDVAGFLFSAVGILYAVVLGFVVVVVWQKYDNAVSNVEGEVDAVGDLYHVVDGYPQPLRSQIRSGILQYAQTVARVEWPAMQRNGEIPDTAANLFEAVSYRIDTLVAKSWKEFAAQQAAIADEQRIFDARRTRLIETVPAVPSVLWFALYAGALAMVAFCFLFGVENRPAQLVMTAILVALIGILFVVIEDFANPFSGSVRISADGWAYLQHRLPYLH